MKSFFYDWALAALTVLALWAFTILTLALADGCGIGLDFSN